MEAIFVSFTRVYINVDEVLVVICVVYVCVCVCVCVRVRVYMQIYEFVCIMCC